MVTGLTHVWRWRDGPGTLSERRDMYPIYHNPTFFTRN